MLTKQNNNWAGFSVKGAARQEAISQPVTQGSPKVEAVLKKLEAEFGKVVLLSAGDPLLNGIQEVPFEQKKQLVYLRYVELYLEAQLAEVRNKIKEIQEEELK